MDNVVKDKDVIEKRNETPDWWCLNCSKGGRLTEEEKQELKKCGDLDKICQKCGSKTIIYCAELVTGEKFSRIEI
jgi:ssDNA-binding Zn-finger/Zn-ribbon topoisomerase 1